jgi:hypothetical protein
LADPIKWGAGKEDRFKDWFLAELTNALTARTSLEQRWIGWLAMYNAHYAGKLKKIPFEGAANETMPVIATDVDQLYASFMQTLHAAPNLWSISALNERWVNVAKPMQDFLQLLDTSVLRMYNVNKRAVLEMVKLGTAIYKTGWTFERRKVGMYDTNGKPQRVWKTRSLPFVDHVRLTDFVIPPDAYAIDPDAQGGAPWVAERMRVSPDRLKMLAKATAPNVPNIGGSALDIILRWEESSPTEYDSHVQRTDYLRFRNEPPSEPYIENQIQIGTGGLGRVKQIELWEVYARFPAVSDDEYDDLVILWHQPTRSIVRATLNPYAHGQRPYDAVRYFPGEGFYGIGVCQQKEMFQRVISHLYNCTTDGAMLGNAMMLGARSGANIAPGEPIYPGKILITDGEPAKDLHAITLGRLDSSLQGVIAMTQTYGERRSGVSDIQLGNINELPGRTPATTMVSLLQEGKRRPDLTIKDMRHEGLSRVGLKVIQLLQQYVTMPTDVGGQRMLQVMVESLGLPEGELLAKQLTMPLESAETGIGVTISATSGSSNKEIDKQNSLALLQLAAQVSPQILQFTQVYAQTVAQPGMEPVAQVAIGAANGLIELYRRALEQYDERDIEAIVPAANTQGPQAPPGLVAGPGGQPAPAPAAPGMGLLPPGLGGAGGNAGSPVVGGALGA